MKRLIRQSRGRTISYHGAINYFCTANLTAVPQSTVTAATTLGCSVYCCGVELELWSLEFEEAECGVRRSVNISRRPKGYFF